MIVEEGIKEVLEYNGPVICEVMTPEWQMLIPRVASDKLPDGTLVSRHMKICFLIYPVKRWKIMG